MKLIDWQRNKAGCLTGWTKGGNLWRIKLLMRKRVCGKLVTVWGTFQSVGRCLDFPNLTATHFSLAEAKAAVEKHEQDQCDREQREREAEANADHYEDLVREELAR